MSTQYNKLNKKHRINILKKIKIKKNKYKYMSQQMEN